MIFANVVDYGAILDGKTDDTQAFIDALAANAVVCVPMGTAKISSTIAIQSGKSLMGSGLRNTRLDFGSAKGAAISFLGGPARLGDISIMGKAKREVGIEIDPLKSMMLSTWLGGVYIEGFDIGFSMWPTGGYAMDNSFGSLFVHSCNVGMRLGCEASGWANANSFEHVMIHSCDVGLLVNGSSGNAFRFLHIESCKKGISLLAGHSLFVSSGWLEKCPEGVFIADYPTAARVHLNMSIDNKSKTVYNHSAKRSDLLPLYQYQSRLAGHWQIDGIEPPNGINGSKIKTPDFRKASQAIRQWNQR